MWARKSPRSAAVSEPSYACPTLQKPCYSVVLAGVCNVSHSQPFSSVLRAFGMSCLTAVNSKCACAALGLSMPECQVPNVWLGYCHCAHASIRFYNVHMYQHFMPDLLAMTITLSG